MQQTVEDQARRSREQDLALQEQRRDVQLVLEQQREILRILTANLAAV